jgi:hypothetical protein
MKHALFTVQPPDTSRSLRVLLHPAAVKASNYVTQIIKHTHQNILNTEAGNLVEM